MTHPTLSPLGAYLQQALTNIAAHDQRLAAAHTGPTLHVEGVASALVFAYEQLRGASENIEDHLLLQRAILRFYKRNLVHTRSDTHALGTELVIELTQAQYLENDTVPLEIINKINALIAELMQAHQNVIALQPTLNQTSEKWLLELLSVRTEQLLQSSVRMASFAHVAHAHFNQLVDYDRVLDPADALADTDRPILLYIAIQKSLLKSDDANARSSLFDLYALSPDNTPQFIEFNKKYDQLAASKSASKLSRLITKNGAPLRIIKSLFFDTTATYPPDDLPNSLKTLAAINTQVDRTYAQVKRDVTRGVIKSIIFLLITKALIGLLIEIPYDLLVYGSIIMLPLMINLLVPPAFLALTALTFRHPGQANKKAIAGYLESMLYATSQPPVALKYTEPIRHSTIFNTIYILIFIGAIYLMSDRLAALEFNAVQGIIFFIFFSTSSFLGYRLTLQIREIEHIQTHQGLVSLIRDFLYSPFIYLGQKISYRFGKLNIIAQILDVAVDLPLKTFIRLLRQWLTFLNNKRDEMM